MSPKRPLDVMFVIRLSFLINIASLSFAAYMMYRVDGIIHGDMYRYGLTFSYDWAVPMWSAERLIFIMLLISILVSVITLFLDFYNGRYRVPTVKRVEVKATPVRTRAPKENHMAISCPKCEKIFSKPLVLLDFANQKTRLVNVCPYCNAVLGEAEEDKGKNHVEVGVFGPDQKAKTVR